jgi:hypothetical protein
LFVTHQYKKKRFISNNVDINSVSTIDPDTKCPGQPDGEMMFRLEKKTNLMDFDFRVSFCLGVSRGLCRFHCEERVWTMAILIDSRSRTRFIILNI